MARFPAALALACAWLLVCADASVGQQASAQAGSSGGYYLGIRTVRLTLDVAMRLGLSSDQGVLIGQVYAGSPADRAGILPGDVILTFADVRVKSADHLAQLLETLPIGSRHRMVVFRQRQPIDLEIEIGRAPAERGPVKAPGPSRDEVWYLHGKGDFWFRVPKGWKIVGDRRNQVADPEFDSLFSPDGQYVIICYKDFFDVDDPGSALEEFVRQKLAEIPHGRVYGMKFGGVPAVTFAYASRDGRLTIYRISFCHAGRRYVINAVAPATEEELPPVVFSALESLYFLRQPDEASPGVDGQMAGPRPPTSAGPPQGPPATAPPIPPVEPPPGWKPYTLGQLKLWLPPEFSPEPVADPKEGRWTVVDNEQLVASIGVLSNVPLNEMLTWMKVQEQRSLKTPVGELNIHIGELSDSGVPGRGMVVAAKDSSAKWQDQILCFFATVETWPRWEASFSKILELMRVGDQAP